MPNILLAGIPGWFQEDLSEQIRHHAGEFTLLDTADNTAPDIILIDEDTTLAEELHRRSLKAPLFLLSSQPENAANANGVTKIFAKPLKLDSFFNELRAGINLYENSADGYLSFNRYEVRPVKKEILNRRHNEIIKLTEKEVAILKYLYKAQDRLVTKTELLQEVWGYAPDASTHTVETHVYRLRQKVEQDDPAAQLILTLDGGYQLKV